MRHPVLPFNGSTAARTFFQYNTMNDLAGDISGTLLDDWAGPIKGALSGEYRYSTLETKSDFNSTAKVDCTGLNPVSCNPNEALWGQSVVSPLPRVGEGVWEAAVELNTPTCKGFAAGPAVRSRPGGEIHQVQHFRSRHDLENRAGLEDLRRPDVSSDDLPGYPRTDAL